MHVTLELGTEGGWADSADSNDACSTSDASLTPGPPNSSAKTASRITIPSISAAVSARGKTRACHLASILMQIGCVASVAEQNSPRPRLNAANQAHREEGRRAWVERRTLGGAERSSRRLDRIAGRHETEILVIDCQNLKAVL